MKFVVAVTSSEAPDEATVLEYYKKNQEHLDHQWAAFIRLSPERCIANMRAVGCEIHGAPLPPIPGNLPVLLEYVADALDRLAHAFALDAAQGIASKGDRKADRAAMYKSMDAVMAKVWKLLFAKLVGFMQLRVCAGECLTLDVNLVKKC